MRDYDKQQRRQAGRPVVHVSGDLAMKRLEDAARRLEQAVARLELVARATAPGETKRLNTALAEAKAENGALEQRTAEVAGRLDAAIARLNAALGPS